MHRIRQLWLKTLMGSKINNDFSVSSPELESMHKGLGVTGQGGSQKYSDTVKRLSGFLRDNAAKKGYNEQKAKKAGVK